jgi:hypothetical protein
VCFATGQDSQDATTVDSDGMIGQYDVWVYCRDPAGVNQQVNDLGCCCHEKRGLYG